MFTTPLLALLLPMALAHVPFDPGDFTITEFDAGLASSGGQWFEVQNNDATDGNNLVEQFFVDADGDEFEISDMLVCHVGEYLVFAREDSAALADFYFPVDFDLRPDAGSILLYDHIKGDVDRVAWDASWGVTRDLPLAVNPSAAGDDLANDLLQNWCAAEATPGEINAWCPGAETDDDGDGRSEQEGDLDDLDPSVTTSLGDSGLDSADSADSAQDSASDSASDSAVGETGRADTGKATQTPCGCSSPGMGLLWMWIPVLGRARRLRRLT